MYQLQEHISPKTLIVALNAFRFFKPPHYKDLGFANAKGSIKSWINQH